MNFKKKLRLRLYTAIIYAVLGIMMIAGKLLSKTDNDFILTLGLAFAAMGFVRIVNYFLITKNEKSIKKQQIAETDERNISILHKAKSAAFTVYVLVSGAAVIVLSLFSLHEAAQWIAYSILLLVIIYWIFYWIYQKKS